MKERLGFWEERRGNMDKIYHEVGIIFGLLIGDTELYGTWNEA